LPRAQTAVRLARAAAALAGAEQGEHVSPARAEAAARLEVAEAHALCATERSGALSVDTDVTTALKRILDAITKGDVEQAQGDIAALLRTDLTPSDDELSLARADSCIDAAVEALGRDGRSAARAWIGDAQRTIDTIVTHLGGGEPGEREEAVVAPTPAEPSATPSPPAAAPKKPASSSEAPEQPAPEGDEADGEDAAEASTASETAAGETDEASD
ncbi:MAG: hypothetical protein ACE5JM_16875, partial [Armatimonadota bacterium]